MRQRWHRAVILVVDDDPGVRQTLQLVLEDTYDVIEAADAQAALAIASSAPIDLVLLDILMPQMDGIATLEQLHAVRPGVPVVIVSALDRASTAATAMRLGAVDYVTRPFEDRMLLDVVSAALRRRAAEGLPCGPRPLALMIGCGARTVAGIAASLQGHLDIESHAEVPPNPVLLKSARPGVLVLEVSDRHVDGLPQAAVVLEHFFPAPAVVLWAGAGANTARLALGPRHLVLEQSLMLTPILDAVCAILPGAPSRQPWHEKSTATVINAIFEDCASFAVKSVVDRLGVSSRHLCRSFTTHAGMSIGNYLGLVRVHMAAFLLRHTDAKLDAVASVVGFHDASHLSRAFVRFTGRRPGQFRVTSFAS